jgi:hypothetical protein
MNSSVPPYFFGGTGINGGTTSPIFIAWLDDDDGQLQSSFAPEMGQFCNTRYHSKKRITPTSFSSFFYLSQAIHSLRSRYLNDFQNSQQQEAFMTTRPKSARKTHVRKPAGRRAARGRTVSKLFVMPVATQANATGADAVIPVSVQGEGSSAEAVIPVEVTTTGKSPKKRAAVIPIAVQKRSAHARRRRAQTRSHQTSPQTRKFEPVYPKPWRRFVSDVINDVMGVGQAALELGVEYEQTAIAVLQSMTWPILGRPADVEPVGRGKVLARRSAAEVAGAALARAA